MSDTQKNAEANINARITELTNAARIVSNTFNLINDVDIKGGHSFAVAEILGWLTGYSKNLTNQIENLKVTLPQPEEVKAIELTEVKA